MVIWSPNQFVADYFLTINSIIEYHKFNWSEESKLGMIKKITGFKNMIFFKTPVKEMCG